jgi:hypothetical protein
VLTAVDDARSGPVVSSGVVSSVRRAIELPRISNEPAATAGERAVLVRDLREDVALMHAMLAKGYRRPEFRELIEGWAGRMTRAADLLEGDERYGR